MPRKPAVEPEGALYVRLPESAMTKLDRAAGALGVAKKDLIAGLVTKYIDPTNRRTLNALGMVGKPQRNAIEPGDQGPIAGSHSFRAYEPADTSQPEVLTVAQAAELLHVADSLVLKLAEAGEIPGRKLGDDWRFARSAIIAWLSKPSPH